MRETMEVRSTMRFARMSPKKMHDLARLIRGQPVPKALQAMQFSHRKGAFLLLKTLKAAVADAENTVKLSADDLVVKEAVVQTGPTLKRMQPKARGMAGRILKRMSHIRIVLTDGVVAQQPEDRKELEGRGTEG